ncbi:MAG: tetratricopeptide repeat protein [Deltaproteobacteria bacterium]|nr:tetratricopeptide repeat protein [Deltaproteobacteria bacterium]
MTRTGRGGIAMVIALLGLTTSGTTSVAAENAAGRASRLFRDAGDRAARGDVDGALAGYAEASAALPHWYLPYLERAALGLRKKKLTPDAVFTDLTRALEIKPDAPEVHFFLGLAERAGGRAREALRHFERTFVLAPAYAGLKEALVDARAAVARLADEEKAARRQAEKAARRRAGARIKAPTGGISESPKTETPAAEEGCGETPEAQRTLTPAPIPAPSSLSERRGRADAALALVQRGAACLGRRRIDDAAFAFARAAMLLPHWVVPHAALAEVLLENDRSPERADAALREVVRLKPDSAGLEFQLALVAERRGRLDEARDRYRALLKKSPSDRRVAERLSIVETARGFEFDPEVRGDARSDDKAVETNGPGVGPSIGVATESTNGAAMPMVEPPLPPPRSVSERHARAREAQAAFLRAQDLLQIKAADAVHFLRRAVQLAPHWALPHVELGILLVKLGQHPERAEAELVRAISIAPANALAHRTLALMADASGRDALAYVHLRKAFALDGSDATIAARLALKEVARGNRDAARAAFERVVEIKPDDAAAWSNLAQLYEQTGRGADAERALLSVVRIYPKIPTPLLELGRFYERQRDFVKAKRAFADAARLDKSKPTPVKPRKKRAMRPLR